MSKFRRQLMMQPLAAPLPYDDQVEWLQCPVGGAIIIPDTFNCGTFTRYVMHFQFTSDRKQQRAFWTGARCVYENGLNKMGCAQNNDWQSTNLGWSTEYILDMNTADKKTRFYNSSSSLLATVSHSAVGNAQTYIRLFNANLATDQYCAAIKCWYFKAYVNENLALDLIPVKKNDVAYMFDNISQTLFGNVGEGSFSAGPVVGGVIHCKSITYALRVERRAA